MIKTGLDFVKGILIGLANIIPGVSGGTVALVLGIYERLIRALRNIDVQFIKSSLGILRFKREAFKSWGEDLKRIDAGFLACIGSGAILAILLTAKLMEFLLSHHHAVSYAFFFGLVLFSIPVPYRYLKRRSWKEITAFILAAVLTVGLTCLVSDKEKIEKEERKLAMKEGVEQPTTNIQHPTSNGDESPAPDEAEEPRTKNQEPRTEKNHVLFSLDHPGMRRLVVLFLAAALAISAMVLPGVSGSFVLLLLGVYFDVLSAINNREIIVLGTFALGCLFGLLSFSRLMDLFLKKFHDVTMAFMIGLMAGSLWGLWPFKRIVEIGGITHYLSNVMPSGMEKEVVASAVAFIVGGAILMAFFLVERRMKSSGQ